MIGLLGSGSWATAIIKILLEDEEHTVNWWVREPEVREGLLAEHHNIFYLREALIDTNRIRLGEEVRETVEQSDDIFIVIPSAFVYNALKDIPAEVMQAKRFHCATKGLIPETNQILTEYLHTCHGVPYSQMTVVSGPSHAEEAARQQLTYLTVASDNERLANEVRQMLNCYYVKTVYSPDIRALQYSTVMKNIYAIGVGMCHGLGYGDNPIAVLIADAVLEGYEFLQHYASLDAHMIAQFAFLGDLLVTCYSQFSRNRTFGQMVGRGYSVKTAQQEMNMVAEGYYAIKGVEKMRRELCVEMPIEQAIYQVLYEHKPARKTMKLLMGNLK